MSAAGRGTRNPNYGKTHSAETREKIAAKARGRILSPKTIAKIARANRGKKHSPEWCAAISAGLIGKGSPIGTRHIHGGMGYVMIKVADGWALEHRLIMEKHLGRALTRREVVHHIDGDRANNAIANLMLFPSQGAHIAHHKAGGSCSERYCSRPGPYRRGLCNMHRQRKKETHG